jgi:hypothetical protein
LQELIGHILQTDPVHGSPVSRCLKNDVVMWKLEEESSVICQEAAKFGEYPRQILG